MRRLLQLVRKETIIPRDLLDELEVWGNKLLELEAGELHAVPQDDIVMHFEEGFPVTFRRVGDKLMVNATQITMHFGKIPSEWLRIASTDMLRREMAGNGHTGKYESQVFTTRGRGHGATWVGNHRLSYRWPDGSPLTCLWRNGWARLSANSP